MTDAATLTAFLFTDIEGSSLKWLNRRAAMQPALAEHDRILRTAIAAHEGCVFKTAGDAFFAAFKRPSDAANAAIAAVRAAVLALHRAGFQVTVANVVGPSAGTVPAAGTLAPAGALVRLESAP